MMKITLNGREAQTSARTIDELLQEAGAPERGVAVARNESVVRRAEWAQVQIEPGDKIEIIRAVQGG